MPTSCRPPMIGCEMLSRQRGRWPLTARPRPRVVKIDCSGRSGRVPPLFWKDSARLADGREIIYYDESPGLGRAKAPDLRPLSYRLDGAGSPAEEPSSSGLRWDALAGEWVIIAAQRQDRTFLPPPEECPLDPSREGRLTEIPADDYDVVVFENRFPSLRGASDPAAATKLRPT